MKVSRFLMSFHVYAGRSHSLGFGGNGDAVSGFGRTLAVPAREIDPAKNRFVIETYARLSGYSSAEISRRLAGGWPREYQELEECAA